jgi:DNA polymerase-3 subunit epsilon
MPTAAQTLAVVDFETTGISPGQGARATEVAAVLVRGGRIVDRFASLMRSGAWVSPFIEQLTGISNRMLDAAPPAEAVMREVIAFTRGRPLVAHNAAFDRGFWVAEARHAGIEEPADRRFACTLLLSRRLYPQAPNYRLGTLADCFALPRTGRAHRALADAETTAQLLLKIQHDLRVRFHQTLDSRDVDHDLLVALQGGAAAQMQRCVARHVSNAGAAGAAATPSHP